MRCEEIGNLLPLHLYGELTAGDQESVERHLAQCTDCQREVSALSRVRAGLDLATVPTPGVDLQRVYRAEAERNRQNACRWRWGAAVAVVVAVLVALARVEIRIDRQRLLVRWGAPEPAVVMRGSDESATQSQSISADPRVADQVRVLQELVHALAAAIESGDRDRIRELENVRGEIARLRSLTHRQYVETRHDVSALYTAQFGSRKEETP